MQLIPRGEIWPGEVPTNSSGSPRPKLAQNRPYFTIHYTGGGLWLDPDDTRDEATSIQNYAESAGKPWEYNWIIDGQGCVVEYAGEYQAAHSGGENDIAIGVLLLVGFAGTYPNDIDYWEQPTSAMIEAVRELRWRLMTSGALALDHLMLKHCDMPDAATACPGDAVKAVWSMLTTPWTSIPEEDDMSAATMWKPKGYANVFLIGAGSTINISGKTMESLTARGVPLVNDEHAQMLETVLHQTGLTMDDLQPE
jgi:hypothetical protein